MLKFQPLRDPEKPSYMQEKAVCPSGEVCTFPDWCALPQTPRTPEEDQCFKRSLKCINIWYGHCKCLILKVTQTPDEVEQPPFILFESGKGYFERGWPHFESSVSDLFEGDARVVITSDVSVINRALAMPADSLGNYLGGLIKPIDRENKERVAQPMLPVRFAEALASKAFTNGSDRVFVAGLYAKTFVQVMSSEKSINFQSRGYEDKDMPDLIELVSLCKQMMTLNLTSNNIRNVAPLCEFLQSDSGPPKMCFVCLTRNQIADWTPLCKMLEVNNSVMTMDLQDVGIGSTSVTAICDMLERNTKINTFQLKVDDFWAFGDEQLGRPAYYAELVNFSDDQKAQIRDVFDRTHPGGSLTI